MSRKLSLDDFNIPPPAAKGAPGLLSQLCAAVIVTQLITIPVCLAAVRCAEVISVGIVNGCNLVADQGVRGNAYVWARMEEQARLPVNISPPSENRKASE